MSSDLHKHTKGVQDSLTHTEGRGEGDKRVQTSVYEHKEQCSDRSRECSLELPLHCALTASCREKRARALGKKGHHRDRGLWAAATDAETPDLIVLIPLLIWRVLRGHRLLRISAPFSAPWFCDREVSSCQGDCEVHSVDEHRTEQPGKTGERAVEKSNCFIWGRRAEARSLINGHWCGYFIGPKSSPFLCWS